MEITIEIPDELAGEVQARALTPEGFVRSLIDDAAHLPKRLFSRPSRKHPR
jgi:hypothetical protein